MRLAVTVDPSLADGARRLDGTVDVRRRGHDLRAADRRRQIDDLDIGEDEVDGTETSAFAGNAPSTARPTPPAAPSATASPVWSRCPAPAAPGPAARCPSRSS